MEVAVLGLNHRTAPVELRERLAFAEHRLPEALCAIRQDIGVPECVILSTCNRVELYAVLPEKNGQHGKLIDFLARFHAVRHESLADERLYWHLQPDSVRHLFRVAAGLDSMVVGESEILGQVREAYAQAVSCGTVGGVFHRLFQTALRAGKDVRTKTRIGQGATSVSSVAVELARRIFRNLSSKSILVLGAGQMGEQTVHCLKGQGIGSVRVANRTPETAEPLARSVGGEVVPMSDLESALIQSDIVLSSTSADHFLLTKPQVQAILSLRRQRPLFFIDISVPRNLDPAIAQLENVYLYDIDDLQGIASSNLRMRLNEAESCKQIIEEQTDAFLNRSPFDGLRVTGQGELVEP